LQLVGKERKRKSKRGPGEKKREIYREKKPQGVCLRDKEPRKRRASVKVGKTNASTTEVKNERQGERGQHRAGLFAQ